MTTRPWDILPPELLEAAGSQAPFGPRQAAAEDLAVERLRSRIGSEKALLADIEARSQDINERMAELKPGYLATWQHGNLTRRTPFTRRTSFGRNASRDRQSSDQSAPNDASAPDHAALNDAPPAPVAENAGMAGAFSGLRLFTAASPEDPTEVY